MDKLVICIILLCSTGYYLVNAYADSMKDDEFNELCVEEYYAMCIEHKNNTITLAKTEEDTSHHQTRKSTPNSYKRIRQS
jgi:hypothetical protein